MNDIEIKKAHFTTEDFRYGENIVEKDEHLIIFTDNHKENQRYLFKAVEKPLLFRRYIISWEKNS